MPSTTIPRRYAACAILLGAFIAYSLTDQRLAFLEDETSIVAAARLPLKETLHRFTQGAGQHEHPPLSDVVMHFWIPVAGMHRGLLRVPSMLFYLAGVLVYAFIARKFAGKRAFFATLWIGVLSPYGFHFGRLAGWYSFCFLLVAFLTRAYLEYVDHPDFWRWTLFVLAATLLVYSNYYGWVVTACLLLDVCFRPAALKRTRFIVVTLTAMVFLYIPFWRAFLDELRAGATSPDRHSLAPLTFNAAYSLYTLFVSESAAPWVLPLSIPAAIAIVVCLVALFVILRRADLRLLGYFAILFAGMAATGILNTRRLLFISGWLLVPIAVAVSSSARPRLRGALVVSLILVGAIGWIGFAEKKFYASGHFIEPWSQIAAEAGELIRNGGGVASNSSAFLFELNYSLQRLGLTDSTMAGRAEHPRVVNLERQQDHLAFASPVLYVKGINVSFPEETAKAEAWLESRCASISRRDLLPDSGYWLKTRLFPSSGQMPFRISLEQYDCHSKVEIPAN